MNGAETAQPHSSSAPSRRTVLGSIAAVGAGALLPTLAPDAKAADKPRRIDTHHHFFAPEWKEAELDWVAKTHGFMFPGNRDWTVDKSLEDMEKGGVSTSVLSLASIPGNWFGGDPNTAVRLSRACNDYAAGIVRDHPRRFGLWASLPMLDVDASLKEIEHAFDELKADGIGLATAYGDKWPGDPMFKPIFDELNRRKAAVYFHPLTPNCCGHLIPNVGDAILEVPHDTARAATSLLISGTLAHDKDIKWLFSHSGGTLPSLAGRINSFYAGDTPDKNLHDWAPDGIMAEFAKLNFDTANGAWAASVAGLLKLVPASHITFGSDYPYFRAAMTAEGLSKLGFSPAQIRGIDHDNIRRLLPNLKAL